MIKKFLTDWFIIGGVTLISYTLVRTNRRSLAIYIRPEAIVEVRAPRHLSKEEIDAFVTKKQVWIEENLTVMRERVVQHKTILQPDDTLPYQGKEFPLRMASQRRLSFDGSAFSLPANFFGGNCEQELIQSTISELYKKLTLPLVSGRVTYYAAKVGVTPSAVKVSVASKRWGSCSGQNSLNFSWMLATTSPEALDYVVVHELCHIQEHNHSPAFWSHVEDVLPDYKQRQALLRETEKRLRQLF